jgi:hypothetical protein
MRRAVPRTRKATLVTHTLVAIATTNLFLFQMAMLAEAQKHLYRQNSHNKAVIGTYTRSTIKKEAAIKARKANACKGENMKLSWGIGAHRWPYIQVGTRSRPWKLTTDYQSETMSGETRNSTYLTADWGRKVQVYNVQDDR